MRFATLKVTVRSRWYYFIRLEFDSRTFLFELNELGKENMDDSKLKKRLPRIVGNESNQSFELQVQNKMKVAK